MLMGRCETSDSTPYIATASGSQLSSIDTYGAWQRAELAPEQHPGEPPGGRRTKLHAAGPPAAWPAACCGSASSPGTGAAQTLPAAASPAQPHGFLPCTGHQVGCEQPDAVSEDAQAEALTADSQWRSHEWLASISHTCMPHVRM